MIGQQFMRGKGNPPFARTLQRSTSTSSPSSSSSSAAAPASPASALVPAVPTFLESTASNLMNKLQVGGNYSSTRKTAASFIPWVSAALLGGALLVGVPALAVYLTQAAGSTAAVAAGSLSAVPAASSACVAAPLLPSLGALTTLALNASDKDSSKSVTGKTSSSSSTASLAGKGKSGGKNGIAAQTGGVAAFGSFCKNVLFSRARRRG